MKSRAPSTDKTIPLPRAPRRMLTPSRERWSPSAREMARRRLVIAAMKWLVPGAGLALLLAIVIWPEVQGVEDRARMSFRRVVATAPDAVRVVAPRYQGVDEQNRPYTVTAAVATQGEDQDIVDLATPRADLLLTDGWVLLEARQGRLNKPRNHLDLMGDVTLWHDGGNLLVTEEAVIELKEGAASGDKPVAAQGPFGTLVSEGFRLIDKGAVVVFTGRARALLEGGQ
ncbi:MAG: export transporter periplasmic protein LptC [Pseudomonadota bacterium]|jgi:lipopolysaccharide export system protein LptC